MVIESGVIEYLSAGICDNCKCPKMINVGGDGINEPVYKELYCKKKNIFIEPQVPEERIEKCEFFEENEN